jgi:hypothetical protein
MANEKQKYLRIPGNILRYHGAIRRIAHYKERFSLFDISHGIEWSYDDALEEADYRVEMVRNTMDNQNIIMPEEWYLNLHAQVVEELTGMLMPQDEDTFDIFIN